MDIIDDLDLLDLPTDLPDGLDFSLDDILDEFRTPGLFTAPVIETEDDVDELVEELTIEESPDETVTEEYIAEALFDIPAHEEPVEEVQEELLLSDNEAVGDPFGLGDILYEFGTPVDEDGVKVYTPTHKEQSTEEDDVKIYGAEPVEEATMLFSAVEESGAVTEPSPTIEQKKKPTLKERFAAWMQTRAAKKAAKQQKKVVPETAVPATEPAETDLDPLDLATELFIEQEETRAAAQEAELLADQIAQQEAEEAARLETELAAQQQALEEEELDALAQEELLAWIESTSKYRTNDISAEEALQIEQAVQEELDYAAPVTEQPAEFFPEMTAEEELAPENEFTELLEDADEEDGLSLEMLDTEPERVSEEPEETPEEAAARKAKEEDDLHYKPEEAPAKAAVGLLGKLFSAKVNALSEDGEAGDREEDLGPEVDAGKAYRYFSKFIRGYRFRMHVAVILCVIIGWISLGLPVFGSMRNTAVAAAMCLMIQLTVMLLGADILAAGFNGLLRKRGGPQGLVTISCLASVLDAVVIIMSKGTAGYLPFCGVSAVSMCFAIYGSLLYCRSQRLNFKTLDQSAEPMTISVDYGIVDNEATTAYRVPGHPEEYVHRSEEEDLSESLYSTFMPVLVIGIPVLSLIAAIVSRNFGNLFHYMAGMFAAAASFSALIAFPLPYFLIQRDLYRAKAAVAGWAGTREIGQVSSMIVTDRDLFPDDTVAIKSVRIVDNVPPQLTLSYMCSLIKASGSCLEPAFMQLADNNDCEILEIENFQCHEAGGLSCDIGPDNVVVASHSYMKLQGFRIPARKKDSENALFLAVNGHVIAYVIMEYKAIKSVRAGLESAVRGTAEMVFAARDFNVTPLLISKKFKSPTDTLRFPSYSQRYEITNYAGSDTATCAAVVSRKSFYSYAMVVEKAKNLYRSVTLSVALSVVSTVLGVLLAFVMALFGTGVSVGSLLIFMLIWLMATVALSVTITK